MLSAVAYSDFYSGRDYDKNAVKSYARRVAYLGSAERIKQSVEREFGRGKISLSDCRDILKVAQRQARPARNLGDDTEPPYSREEVQIINGSGKLLDALKKAHHGIWPCGCIQTRENTHTVAGVRKCKTCRRKRWNAGFKRVCNHKLAADLIRNRGEIVSAKARQEAYERAFPRTGARKPLDLVIAIVEAEFGLPTGTIVGKGRKTVQVFARSVVARILRDRGVSYPRIGAMLGDRDHSTILNMDRK